MVNTFFVENVNLKTVSNRNKYYVNDSTCEISKLSHQLITKLEGDMVYLKNIRYW